MNVATCLAEVSSSKAVYTTYTTRILAASNFGELRLLVGRDTLTGGIERAELEEICNRVLHWRGIVMRLGIQYLRSNINVRWSSSGNGYFIMNLLPLPSDLHSGLCPIDQLLPGLDIESKISIRRGITE